MRCCIWSIRIEASDSATGRTAIKLGFAQLHQASLVLRGVYGYGIVTLIVLVGALAYPEASTLST